MDDAAPPPIQFRGFSKDRIDDAVVHPELYASGEIDDLFKILRETEPVRLMHPQGYRPFWSITKHADVMEVEKNSDVFVNRLRTYLTPIEGEENVKKLTGDTHLFRSLVDIDDPQHMKLRALTQGWFMPPNLKKLEARIGDIAKTHVDRMAELGTECDFVKEVAVWYPLRVIMQILGVPKEDEPFMLKLTQEIFGSGDPDVVSTSERATGSADTGNRGVDLMQTAQVLFQYFGALSAARRANPTDDVATVIANAKIDGQPISDLEAMSYYVIIATAGHDTTSSVTAGGLQQLIQSPDEMRKLKGDLSLLPNAVEEMIRWVTPVKHFMRTAMTDYSLRGQTIKAGDGICLHYPSANRDAEVFEDPFRFRVDRPSGRHLAFGYGVHLCLGMHLARMEIKALFAELLPRLSEITAAGAAFNTRSNFVSGLKTLPVRYKMAA